MKNKQPVEIWHTIIIGAGASGLFCAGSFAAPKLVLEHNKYAGAKLNITGGGKCNFTHLPISERDYVCQQKHFVHSVLAAFTPAKIIHLLEEAHIPFTRQENGCLFAKNARDITQLLFQRAKENNTSFSFNTEVLQILRENNLFTVRTSKGLFYAHHVVVASGGLSYPQLGASGFAGQTAQSFKLPVVKLRPALVGLRVDKKWRERCRLLAGNSLPVQMNIKQHQEEGSLLFTHEGFSGPAVLQSSLYWQEGEKMIINFCPSLEVLSYLKEHKQDNRTISKILADFIPVKIAKTLLQENDVKMPDATKQQLVQASQAINHFEFTPVGTAGYTQAEVTAGGIDTKSLDTYLQCKTLPGLFFIGEAVDVTGRVGGYNLHWAWASAYTAAQALQKALV